MIIPVCLAIGAGLLALTFLLSIVFIDPRPGRHRAETAPGRPAPYCRRCEPQPAPTGALL